jgi:DNA-binding LacI/PurR family transcriptional regulator
MATISDVAARAGVSRSTVSRVFLQPQVVAEDARRRVLAAAETLGYEPSPVARSLRRGRTGNLGLVVPDIANPFFPPLIKAVQRQARRHQMALFVADSDEHADDELALVRAMAKQVDGLILASPRVAEADLRALIEGTPTVVINRRLEGIPAVVTTPEQGMTQAVEHLAALGHGEIVYLSGPELAYSNQQRRQALENACRLHGLRLSELGPFEPHFESGVRAGDLVLAQAASAVVAYNDQIALGLLARLSERGTRVGQDVSVIGIDDTWLARMASPALTTVRVPAGAAGAAAVRLMVDVLSGGPVDGAAVELATELIVRSSTTAPPRPAATA